MRCVALQDKVDVAVVGGGPGGLATALGLKKHMPQLTVKVYEAAPCYKPQGAGVLLNINGARALNWLEPSLYERLVSSGMPLNGLVTYDEQGNKMGEMTLAGMPNVPQFEVKPTLVPWYRIRDELYNALPEGVVQFGLRGTDVQLPSTDADPEAPLTLTVESRDDPASKQQVEAQLVVAADGYRSRIQKLVFTGDDQPPVFNNRMVWRARAAFGPGQVPEVLNRDDVTSVWWTDTGKFVGGKLFVVYKVGPREFVWTASAPMDAIAAAGVTATESNTGALQLSVMEEGAADSGALGRVRKVLQDYPAEVLQLMDATDDSIVTEHGIVTHSYDALPKVWSRGRLLLLGDAAHSFPVTGQGCNVTLEDAAVLVDVLRNLGINKQSLDIFNKQRYPRVRGVLKYGDGFNPLVAIPFLPAALDYDSIIDPQTLIPASAVPQNPMSVIAAKKAANEATANASA